MWSECILEVQRQDSKFSESKLKLAGHSADIHGDMNDLGWLSLLSDIGLNNKQIMIALNKKTAVFFDSETGNVSPIVYDGELDEALRLIKADMIDVIRLDEDHVVIVDDEGFLKHSQMGWMLKYGDREIKFAGSGILTGDICGSNAPVTLEFPKLEIHILEFKYEETETEDQE